MIPQLRSEWLKLRTMRTTWALLLAAVAMVTFIIIVLSLPLEDAAGGQSPADSGITANSVVSFGTMAQLFVLALGVLASAGEFRHQTITPTLLARPDRLVVITTKTIVCAVTGLVFGLITGAIAVGGAMLLVSLDRVSGQLEAADALRNLAGVAATTAAWAALGVAIGMLVRNQIVALVGSIAYLFLIDSLLQLLVPAVWKWLPSGAADAVIDAPQVGDTQILSPVAGGLVLVAWVAVIVVAAAELLRRRDVS